MPCFRDRLEKTLDIMYSGDGHEMARQFYIPLLKSSKKYDRVTGYFSVDSLIVVAAGLSGLVQNRGRIRLVVGIHDLGPELKEIYWLSRERAEELLKEIGNRIGLGLERIEDVFERRRLEALAWMLVEGLLEIKVAIPKRTFLGLGNGIFHEKVLLFYGNDGCVVGAAGGPTSFLILGLGFILLCAFPEARQDLGAKSGQPIDRSLFRLLARSIARLWCWKRIIEKSSKSFD